MTETQKFVFLCIGVMFAFLIYETFIAKPRKKKDEKDD